LKSTRPPQFCRTVGSHTSRRGVKQIASIADHLRVCLQSNSIFAGYPDHGHNLTAYLPGSF
jgi:hypothetical protein